MNTARKTMVAVGATGMVIAILLFATPLVGPRPVKQDDHEVEKQDSNDRPRAANTEPHVPQHRPQQPGHSGKLEVLVRYKNLPAPAEATLFARSLGANATIPVHLARRSDTESLVGKVELLPGDYVLALGENLALDHSMLHVSGAGYRTSGTADWTDFSKVLALNATAGYSLRVETITEDGRLAVGTLKLLGFPDPVTLNRRLATPGTAVLYQVPIAAILVEFHPEDPAFEPASVRFDPPSDTAGQAVALRITVMRKLAVTVRFLDPAANQTPGASFILQVTHLDSLSEDGQPKKRALRLTDGALLPAEAVAGTGTYRFEWVRDGITGPTVEYTRSQLGGIRELVVLAPSVDQKGVCLFVVDTAGKPLAGVVLELTYQGTGWQKVAVTTDKDGSIRIPQWNRQAFSLVVRPPTGVDCVPALLMNPVDGARMVMNVSNPVRRLAVTIDGNIVPLLDMTVSLRLWAPPDISQRDWESVVRYNDRRPVATISGPELRIPDTLTGWQFENPAKLWVVAELRDIQIGQWVLSEFEGYSEAAPATIRVISGGLAQVSSVAMPDMDGKWLLAPGRRSVAAMLSMALRRNRDPDLLRSHGTTETAGGQVLRLICSQNCPVFTAFGSDGTLVVLRASWTGSAATLSVEQVFHGGTLLISDPSGTAPRLVITGSYFQQGRQIMYWDEFAADYEQQSLPLSIAVPADAPILVLPLTADYGPTREPLELSDYVHRTSAGGRTEVRLR